MAASLTKAELEITPHVNTSANRHIRINAAAASAAQREALSFEQGFPDALAISIDPRRALVLVADRLTAEQVARLTGAITVLEEGEVALAPVLGTSQVSHPDNCISPRECEVLALVAEGRSNKAIAAALFVSPNTVKSHVTALLTKLDAHNRTQLATIAARRGLLADNPGAAAWASISPD